MNDQRKLTIAMVLATPGTAWGGMEKHTAELAGELAVRGHAVHVIGHPGYHHRFADNVDFHPAPVQLGRRNPWLQHALRRLIRRITPDVLHAQGNKAAQLVGKLKTPAGQVRVGTVHGIKSSHRAFEPLDAVIAVSQQIFDGLQHPNKHLIFNGIAPPPELAIRPYDSPALPAGAVNVLAAGRLEPVKGFSTLIRAWAQIAQRVPGAHLTIAGEGSLRTELGTLAANLGLDHQITLAGYRSDLTQLYRQADLVVISSEREGFPYVLVESLLAGCPVVSTPVSGASSLLPEQALSPGHGVDDLAELLSSALANLPALKTAEAPAMAFARQRLTLQHMTHETEALYRAALASRQHQGT